MIKERETIRMTGLRRAVIFLSLLSIIIMAVSPAFAAPFNYLKIYEVTYREDFTPSAPTTDPTLINSADTKTTVGTHNGHDEIIYQKTRVYQSLGSVSYNDYPSTGIGVPAEGHSAAYTNGYVGRGIMRQKADVTANGSDFSQSWTWGQIKTSFAVLPGSSGRALGDTVTIRADLRLDGDLYARGTTYPGSGSAFPHLQAGLSLKDPLEQICDSEGCYTPKILSFGAAADIDAGPVNKYYWGYTFSSYTSSNWGAYTNTGINLSDRYADSKIWTSENQSVSDFYHFDTFLLQLEFNAIVGHMLNLDAYLDVFSFASGTASASSDFSNTFGISIDPNNTGVLISWQGDSGGSQPVPEPATMLLLGSGLVGLAGFRRKFRRK